MTRAYLRLDPHLETKKRSYPDGAIAAFVFTLCLADQQSPRGSFRNTRLLRVLLDRRARWLPYLIHNGDLVVLRDGSVYVDGWDEWQEGDWKVAERVARIRSRSHNGVTATVTEAVTPDVTPDVTPGSVSTPSSVSGERRALSISGAALPAPQTFMGFRPAKPEPLTPEAVERYRQAAEHNRDPLVRENARRTLEQAGLLR